MPYGLPSGGRVRVLASSAAVAAVLGGVLAWNVPKEEPRLTFLSVGQGSCAVLRAGGRTILFDAGPKNQFVDGGERFVMPKLRAMGVKRVDVVVLSHPDMDHAGGLESVMKAYPEARILTNAGFAQEPKLPEMLTSLGVSKERIGWLPPYARLQVGAVQIDLASPVVVPGANDNDGSVLARISGGAFIGGDAPSEVERIYR
ncbi:MBL fold metallo-hydrolase, partial [bacterium]